MWRVWSIVPSEMPTDSFRLFATLINSGHTRVIRDMPSAILNVVLRVLGMDIDGRVERKKQRLRVQMGLKADLA
jgi:hypothetical protein